MGKNYIAIDLGSSSGRVLCSTFHNNTLKVNEIHRFETKSYLKDNLYYWDYNYIFSEIKLGLKKCKELGINIDTIGVDSWGVDYALLNSKGNIIGAPLQYRNDRTSEVMNLNESIDNEMYNISGIAKFDFNTVYQLLSDKIIRKDILNESNHILLMADLINYLLTGNIKNEYTLASTTGLIDATTKNWNFDIINKLDINSSIFNSIIKPGEVYGILKDSIRNELDLNEGIKVIAVGSHDTASAVTSIPYDKSKNGAYLVSGSWSLLGVELDNPILNSSAKDFKFSNEGGTFDKIRFLKNINGLFLLQQLKKEYSSTFKEISFVDIISEAENVINSSFIIDPTDYRFQGFDSIISSIKSYCISHNQGDPNSLGEYAISIYNGLVKEYKMNLDALEKLTKKQFDTIYMVGGGIQDEFLCKKIKNELKIDIITGPVEASAFGNILLQMYGNNDISSIDHGRELLKKNIEIKIY